MLKQQDMTETAAAVLHFLPADKWVTPRMMTRTTGVSEARCQLILTQLVLAGLAKDNGGYGNKFGTVAKLAMRQPFVLFKGLTFQKLCLPGAFRPG
ncbi:hypothetical protein ACRWFX_25965, partial [Escherichia coli]